MGFQDEITHMGAEQLHDLQLERLKATVANCYEHIPFYKRSFDEAGFDPYAVKDLDDLQKAPFSVKQDMRDAYPFGMFARPLDEVRRIHASSGTTGTATVVGYTEHDMAVWGDCFARGIEYAGGGPGTVVQVGYGYGLFTGGLGASEGCRRIGALELPMSSGNTQRQVKLMKDFGSGILACTPSYALHIADTAIEMGEDPSSWPIFAGIFGAEPWSNEMRKDIEEKLGICALDIYGLSEVMGPGVAIECREQNGLHIAEDHFIVEVVDPETDKPVPDGEWGELVFTSLSKDCSPVVRYRSSDISRIIEGECACGRPTKRIDRIAGRTDDMMIIRGVNVFPSQIEQVVVGFTEVAPHYVIELSNDGPLDKATLKIETVPDFPIDEVRKIEDLQKRLQDGLKSELQVKVDVKVVEPKTIERSLGKAKRIVDLREKGE